MKTFLKNVALLAICFLMASCMSGKGGDRSGGRNMGTAEVSTPQAPAESGDGNSNESNCPQTQVPTSEYLVLSEHPIVNVYLENSGSMNGYVDNGQTLFQQDVFNYLCDIHISEIASEMNLHFINSEIIKKGSVIAAFIKNLTPNSFKTSGGQTATTDIADMFKQVLEHTDNNTVSVFISDCIFSPGSIANPEAYLANQQVGIKKSIADHLSKYPDFSVVVYQLYSNFKGTYYDYKNRGRYYNGERPYYIWVMGHTAHIAKLRAKIPNDKFSGSGVANMWCASSHAVTNVPYSVVPKAVKGDFRRNGNNAMSRIKKENGEFAFKVTANLDELELLLGNDYLMDSNNYSRLINKYDTNEWYIGIERNSNSSSPATHNITLGTSQNALNGNLSVALCCKAPKWAYELTDSDDSTLTSENSKKTYGLKYMIDGVQQAFVAKTSGVYTVMDFKLN